jgi:uncharacterized membrane protein
MPFATIKFVHLLSLLLLFSASLAKNLLVAAQPFDARAATRCRTADRISGAAAGLIVLSGIALVLVSPKGADFYTSNASLWIKVAVLILASALILRTKVYFRAAATGGPSVADPVPAAIVRILRVDLASLVLMAWLGVLVAYGIGLRVRAGDTATGPDPSARVSALAPAALTPSAPAAARPRTSTPPRSPRRSRGPSARSRGSSARSSPATRARRSR